MKLIGLTGGIGSGKSIVAGMFRTLGIPVFGSDPRAKELMNEEPAIRQKIINLFGTEAYLGNNELNRPWIASQVFSNPDQLQQLNAIVHPAVYEDLKKWADEESQRSAPYLIQESAILFEENLTGRMQAIILVVAPEELRIERAMKRDYATREQIIKRMENQWPDEKKIPLSDYIIFNDGQRSLIDQVRDIDIMIRSTFHF